MSATATGSRATCIEMARIILSRPLCFGDPAQIEAREFLEAYETAAAILGEVGEGLEIQIVSHEYGIKHRLRLDELEWGQLQTLDGWLQWLREGAPS